MRSLLIFICLTFAVHAEEGLVHLPEVMPLNLDLIAPEKQVEIPLIDPPKVVIIVAPKNCPADFHREVTGLEKDRAALWELMQAAKKADYTLSTRRFQSPDIKGERLFSLMRGNSGVDPTLYTTHPIGDILYRSLAEFKGYTTQRSFAGICSGAKDLTKFYKERNLMLFKRGDDYKAAIALYALEAEKEVGETPRRTSLIAAHYFLRDAAFRYVALSDGVKGLFDKVDAAHVEHCGCSR
jgi:hypothetical protein